ncbi:MAG: GntR family transcriptional regulator, partial [Acidobacteriota bacterium]
MSPSASAAARPLYQQIKDRIAGRIARGEWTPGQRIPSENEIVRELGVSRMTVNRALREMAQEGHLLRVAGVGTFVAEPPRRTSLVEIRDIAEDVRASGASHRAEVLARRSVALDAADARRMEVAPGTEAFRITLVHRRDELPIQHEDRFISRDFLPDFFDLDFTAATPSEVLLGRIAPEEVEHTVEAVAVGEGLRRRLAMAPAEPAL